MDQEFLDQGLNVLRDSLPEGLEATLRNTPGFERAYLVGGCVRDALLGYRPKDFDIEVFGMGVEELTQKLSGRGRTHCVGRAFGVVKLGIPGEGVFDFSLPRRDSKVGPGHRGFIVEPDPDLTFQEAAERRDYTINALGYGLQTGELLDPTGGLGDLRNKTLRHVGPAFDEDPLRVLRGMQFAARFEMIPASETVDRCAAIVDRFSELSVERVWEEWWKWATRSARPSLGIEFLEATGWIDHFPEIRAIQCVDQDPEWHPEGDVLTHTKHCLDALVTLERWRQGTETLRAVLGFAVLAHDFGKATTTRREMRDGRERIVSPGHDRVGADMAIAFLERMRAPNETIRRVPLLVENHLNYLQATSSKAIRRLARRLEPETIENLCAVIAADQMGRPPRPRAYPREALELKERADQLDLSSSAPEPILKGRNLVARGLKPGPVFSEILAHAMEAQLDGEFEDEVGAEAWLDSFLARRADGQ